MRHALFCLVWSAIEVSARYRPEAYAQRQVNGLCRTVPRRADKAEEAAETRRFRGFLTDGMMIEWLKSHTNVIYRPSVGHRAYAIRDDEKECELEVAAIHVDAGYKRVRESLSRQYDIGSREPSLQVWNVNLRGVRLLTLRHFQHNDRPLHDSATDVLKHVARLWGLGVQLESANGAGKVSKRGHVAAPCVP